MSCYFAAPTNGYRIPNTSKIKCNHELTILETIPKANKAQLYGCENVMDLVLMRGLGESVNWEDDAEVERVSKETICRNHLDFLYTHWGNRFISGRPTRFPVPATCSIPLVQHANAGKKPKTRIRIQKCDALSFTSYFNVVCHPGAFICTAHLMAIRSQNFDQFTFEESDNYEETIEGNPTSIVDDFESNLNFDPDYELPVGSPIDFLDDEDVNDAYSNNDPLESSKSQKDDALRALARLFNLSRLTSDVEWDKLQPETQRKKVSDMLHLHDQLYKQCAGEKGWRAMRDACMKKAGQVVEDSRVEKVLQTIDERLSETTDRETRLGLISVISGHFSEKEIIRATGVSRYFIREAKKYALFGFESVTNFRRVRYDLAILKQFIAFISRPEIIVSLPNPARVLTLSSGEEITLAKVARLHSYRRVVEMYRAYLESRGIEECSTTGGDVKEFVRTHALGYSTCVKLMETILPVRRQRMQCLDNFQAEAMEGFDNAFACVAELKTKGLIPDKEASDLNRRLRVSLNYISGFFRMHLSMSSTCGSHCIRFALSDASPHFHSDCDHDHTDVCDQCDELLSVFVQFKSFLKEKSAAAHKNNHADRFRIARMLEECEEAEARVLEYQRHIVRAAMSERDRVTVLEGLLDTCVLITMDFALKLMPSGFLESQSQWFGKRGISFQVSHVQGNVGGRRVHHTLGHLNDDWKQDANALCIIANHLFGVLAENGVKMAVIRSDNAGSYHNSGLIYTFYTTAKKYGITIIAYLFSEPQSGKGIADQKISIPKMKLVDVVNAGGYGRNAEEIVKSLCADPLLSAYSFYTITGEQVTKPKCTINQITNLSSFRYEDDGVRVRKHNEIGDGLLVSSSKWTPGEYTHKIGISGGHLSQSPGFWGSYEDQAPKKQIKQVVDEEPEDGDVEGKFRCTEDGCIEKFLTLKGLQKHHGIGKHTIRVHSDTITEAAAKLFCETVETNEDAYLSMQADSMSTTHGTARSQKLKEGWAVRVKNRTNAIDPEIRRFVKRYFIEQRSEGKRAEAKVVVQLMRNKTDPKDGSYVFPLKKCLKESQAQSLITRFLAVESSKVGLKGLESDVESAVESEEEEENGAYTDLIIESAEVEMPVVPKRKRGKKSQSNESKTPTRKAAKSVTKKGTNVSEGEGEHVDSTEAEASTRKRGRPKKTPLPTPTASADNDKKKQAVTSPSTRVLRKRGSTEQQKIYCEISSDEEIDDYTAMMNAIHDNHSEIFTDENE